MPAGFVAQHYVMIPDWAEAFAATLGLSLVDHGGSGDCALKATKGQWQAKNSGGESTPPTRADVVASLKDLCSACPDFKLNVTQQALAEEAELPGSKTRSASSPVGATSEASLKKYLSNLKIRTTYFDESMLTALKAYIEGCGLNVTIISLRRAYPLPIQYPVDTGGFMTLADNNADILQHLTAQISRNLNFEGNICLAVISEQFRPLLDHVVQFVSAGIRASKIAATAALSKRTKMRKLIVFNVEQANVHEFDAARREGAVIHLRSKGKEDDWWPAKNNDLDMLTIPVVQRLESGDEKVLISALDEDIAADPTWAMPGRYNKVSCRTTTLSTSFELEGFNYLFKANWVPSREKVTSQVVLIERRDLPADVNVTALLKAAVTAGGKWCKLRHVDGPGARHGPSRALSSDMRLRGCSGRRWPAGLCLPGSIALAMHYRGHTNVAHALEAEFSTQRPFHTVAHWLAGSSVVTKSFIVTVLPAKIALSEVLQRRGSCQIIALWVEGHAVCVDLQLAVVFDVEEPCPLALPATTSAAVNLIARLTGAHAGGGMLLNGAISLVMKASPDRPHRRRGSRAGKKRGRPGMHDGQRA